MTEDPARLQAEGLAAMGRGDMTRAVELLRAASTGIARHQMNWIALANAEIANNNSAAAEAAIDAQLSLAPQNLSALLLKGLLREQAGDRVAASSFYRAGINEAAQLSSVPATLERLLGHANRYVVQSSETFNAFVEDRFGKGLSPAMTEAVEVLLGKRQLYFQDPTLFHYPGLPQKRFYDPAQFPWFAPMLALVPQMREELRAVLEGGARGFAPYVHSTPNRPAVNTPLLDNQAWSAFHFWRDGKIVEENAAICPATMEALAHVPLVQIEGRCPNAHWSRLLPGAHITPHVGMLNTRLICHIPILTAPRCWLRVGSETREWIDGVPLVFDDTIEHEAKNDGPQERVILLFEIWRPEVDEADREAIGQVFEAIGQFT